MFKCRLWSPPARHADPARAPAGPLAAALALALGFAVALAAIAAVPHALAQGQTQGQGQARAQAHDDVDCHFRDKDREASYTYADYCGLLSGSEIVYLLPEFIERVWFEENGLGCINFDRDHWFWIRRDGTSIRTPMWEVSCAPFRDGLGIAELGGRQAYIDESLEVVLDPGFESLGAFVQGYAVVCNGPFVIENPESEHPRSTGGRCGLIDRSGALVVEAVHPVEDHLVFRDYRNAHNECPPPPIADEASALCHARRLARGLGHSDDWETWTLERDGDVWAIEYRIDNRNRSERFMTFGAEKAEFRTGIRADLRPLAQGAR